MRDPGWVGVGVGVNEGPRLVLKGVGVGHQAKMRGMSLCNGQICKPWVGRWQRVCVYRGTWQFGEAMHLRGGASP